MSDYDREVPEFGEGGARPDFETSPETEAGKRPGEIERDIAMTRERMSENIDELGERLSPDQLKEQAKGAIKEAAQGAVSNVGDQARRTGQRLLDAIREHPLPVMVAGVGVTWLLTQRSRSKVSGDRMAQFAYTGPERRSGYGGDPGRGVGEGVGEPRPQAGGRAQEAGREARQQVRQIKTKLEHLIDQHPLAVAAGAAVVGLGLGMLLPSTQKEDEVMGPGRDRLVDRAEAAAERVKDVAIDAGQKMKETIKEQIDAHAPEIKHAVRQTTEAMKEQAKESVGRATREATVAGRRRPEGGAA